MTILLDGHKTHQTQENETPIKKQCSKMGFCYSAGDFPVALTKTPLGWDSYVRCLQCNVPRETVAAVAT